MPKAEAQFAASGGGVRVVGFVGGFGAAAVPLLRSCGSDYTSLTVFACYLSIVLVSLVTSDGERLNFGPA